MCPMKQIFNSNESILQKKAISTFMHGPVENVYIFMKPFSVILETFLSIRKRQKKKKNI